MIVIQTSEKNKGCDSTLISAEVNTAGPYTGRRLQFLKNGQNKIMD